MSPHRSLSKPLAMAVAALVLPVAAASANTPIPVSNHSFENPTLSSGGYVASFPDWSTSAVSTGHAGIWNDSAIGKDGNNIVYLYTGYSLAQNLGHTIQPDATYTFDVLFGFYDTGGGNSGLMEVYAGGTVEDGFVTGGQLLDSLTLVASDSSTMDPFSFDWTAPSSGGGVGESLSVRLAMSPQATNGTYGSFDKVEVGLVPEPASLSLLGIGALMLCRRRRQA